MALTQIPIELSSTTGIVDNSTGTAITIDASGNVDVTGTVAADGLTVDHSVDTAATFTRTSANTYRIEHDLNQFYFWNATTSEAPLIFQNDGDVIMKAGNVGIGTESPQTLLHLNSTSGAVLRLERQDGSVVTNDTLGKIEFYTNDVTNPGVAGYIESQAEQGSVYASMIFGTGLSGSASEAMRIDSSGNVDIGSNATASAGASKQLLSLVNPSGTASTAARLWMSGTNATTRGTYIEAEVQSTGNDHDLIFATSASGATPTEAMRIDSAGNVGISTTSPENGVSYNAAARVLGIAGSGAATSAGYGAISLTNNRATPSGSDDLGKISFGSSNDTGPEKAYIYASAVGSGGATGGYGANMIFATRADNGGLSNNMTLDSSGNVGIGQSSPTSAKLQVKGAGTTVSTNSIFAENSSGAGLFAIRDNGEAFILGNTGIGTSPDANSKLHILDDTSSPDDYTVHIEAYIPAVVFQDISGGPSTDFALQADGSSFMFRYGDASTGTQLASEAMRIDSSGDVIIGSTVAPVGAGLAVNSGISSSSTTAIEIQQNTTGAVKAAAALGVAVQNGGEATNAADLTFSTASGGSLGEAMRIESDGTVRIKTGSLVVETSGEGIFLGGTGAANNLDYYERGTHQTTATPETSGTIGLFATNDDISYVKIGDSVHIVGCVVVQSVSSPVGDYVEFSLPFQITDLTGSSGRFGNASTYLDSSSSTFSLLPMQAIEGVSLVRVYIDASTLGANDQFYFSFLYRGD